MRTTGHTPADGADPLVDHPTHYNSHPSGVEIIDLIEHLMLNPGTAVKYATRFRLKGTPEQDIDKAVWYTGREIKRLAAGGTPSTRAPEDIWEKVITAEDDARVRMFLRLIRSQQYEAAHLVALELHAELLADSTDAGRIDR